jgi:hypothetical protein
MQLVQFQSNQRVNKMPKRNGERYDPVKQAAFLAAFAQVGNITAACKIAKIERRSHYDWINNDTEYQSRFEVAKLEAIENMETEARRRAVEGFEEPVFGSGGKEVGTVQVGTIRKFSDTLLIFLLKAADPDKYRDRLDHRHSGSGGGPIQASVTIQQVMDLLDSKDGQSENT